MPVVSISNITGLNLFINPLNLNNGELLKSVNMYSFPYGGKRKRSGYATYLGTPDTAEITTLFSWARNDGTTFHNYRVSGSKIYYSAQGTGAWTVCGNGTVSNGAHVGYAVLDDVLILGDGVGSTRHTTDGTSFTNTTLAPIGQFFAQYQNSIWIGGTASTLFKSSSNSATDWATSGTSDSTSYTIPGPGKMGALFTCADRLQITKNSGAMYNFDGFRITDMGTDNGPSSPYSVDSADGFYFWLNRKGYSGFGGARPQLLSNAIQPQIYNPVGSAIAGTAFDTAPGVVHKYDYLASVGTVTDDVVRQTISNCVQLYDYQKNEFYNFSLAHRPTAWLSYVDNNRNEQLMFGNSSGQCYQFSGTARSDAGSAIQTGMQFMVNTGAEYYEKKFKYIWLFFNPGNEAQVQISVGDSYDTASKNWVDIGDCSSGVIMYEFPIGSRGRLCFVNINESSKNSDFIFYGYAIDAEAVIPR